MILAGDPIPAQEALATGLVDEIVEGDLIAGAIAFARRVLEEKRPLRRVRDMEAKIEPLRGNPGKFDELAAAHTKNSRGLQAPAAAIEALRWTLDMPIDEAQKREREKFMELLVGEQSKAQRHIFFAEREAAKVPGMPKDVQAARDQARGRDRCRHHGRRHRDELRQRRHSGDDHRERRRRAQARHRDDREELPDLGARGSLSAGEMDRRIALFNGVTDIAAVGEADIVIEAVFEDMEIKKQVFAQAR